MERNGHQKKIAFFLSSFHPLDRLSSSEPAFCSPSPSSSLSSSYSSLSFSSSSSSSSSSPSSLSFFSSSLSSSSFSFSFFEMSASAFKSSPDLAGQSKTSRGTSLWNSLNRSLREKAPEWVSGEEEDEKLYKLAFLIAGAQALLLATIIMLYYNWVMLESCIIPFFWAAIVNLCLQPPKDNLLQKFNSASDKVEEAQRKRIRKRPTSPSPERRKALFRREGEKEKERISDNSFSSKTTEFYQLLGVPSFLHSFLSSLTLFFHSRALKFHFFLSSLSFSLPGVVGGVAVVMFGFVTGPGVSFFASFVSFFFFCLGILCDRSYHNTLVTIYILVLALSVVVVVGNFLVGVLAVEMVQFISMCKEVTQDAGLIEHYGLTQDYLIQRMDTIWDLGENFLIERGYNVSVITNAVLGGAEGGFEGGLGLGGEGGGEGGGWGAFNVSSLVGLWEGEHLEHLQEDFMQFYSSANLQALQTTGKHAFGLLFGSGISVAGHIASISTSIANFVTGLVVFLTSLYYLLYSSVSLHELDFLPIAKKERKKIATKLHHSIFRLFESTLLISLLYSLTNFLLWKFMGLPYPYSVSVISGTIAIFPFLPLWLVYIPPLLILSLTSDPNFYPFLVVICVVYVGLVNIRSAIHELVPQSHAYITGLAMVLGYTTFGIEGVLIGPLLIVMTVTIYEIFQDLV